MHHHSRPAPSICYRSAHLTPRTGLDLNIYTAAIRAPASSSSPKNTSSPSLPSQFPAPSYSPHLTQCSTSWPVRFVRVQRAYSKSAARSAGSPPLLPRWCLLRVATASRAPVLRLIAASCTTRWRRDPIRVPRGGLLVLCTWPWALLLWRRCSAAGCGRGKIGERRLY